ncbi:MAG: 50S ribosomal protein L24 [Deltaproteobacteria bacterium]|nr:50S ribosomal protein L24 [Deltaproteobacteria bacterium]
MKRIKKGDTVQVVAGKEKGKTGKVLKIMEKNNRLVVEKANMIKRHQKPTAKIQGGIVEKEGSLEATNVMPYCTKCKKGVRVTFNGDLVDGKKVRRCAKCGENIG